MVLKVNEVKGGYLKFLTDDQLGILHESTLKVLENTGVLIDSDELQNIFKEQGAVIDKSRGIVRIPLSLVEESIKRAPKGVTLYGRREGHELRLEDHLVHAHTIGGEPFLYDLETGKRRPALRKDIETTARLVDALDNIHSYSPIVFPSDVDAKIAEAERVYAAVRNTTKPIGNTVASKEDVIFTYRIFTVIAGGEEELKKRPMGEISASPISPLFFDKNLCEALMKAAELNIPTTILPCPMAGGSAPITLAGALVQQNAELLAGLTITQITNPGTPVILGPRLSIIDMRSGCNSWGAPELGMASACAVQLAQYYGLPTDVYGLCTDSRIMDQQAGYERAMNALLPALAGANSISGAGPEPEQLVVDNEILGMIFKVLKTFEINEETLALDVIGKVGPRGNFFAEVHTARYARAGELYFPRLSNRLEWEEWVRQGSKDIIGKARAEAQEILKNHEVRPLDDYALKELDNIMINAREHCVK
jgi:trimethylamine--corrinoid protein Co-methyltransferase